MLCSTSSVGLDLLLNTVGLSGVVCVCVWPHRRPTADLPQFDFFSASVKAQSRPPLSQLHLSGTVKRNIRLALPSGSP